MMMNSLERFLYFLAEPRKQELGDWQARAPIRFSDPHELTEPQCETVLAWLFTREMFGDQRGES